MNSINYYLNNIDPTILIMSIWGIYMSVMLIVGSIMVFVQYLLTSIALYIMAVKAGYDYSFVAFIPYANMYIMHMLPVKEYSFMGLYKTPDRAKGFLIYAIIIWGFPILVIPVVSVLASIPVIGMIVSLLYSVLVMFYYVAYGFAKAIPRIDLFETYMRNNKGLSITLGVLSIFIPIIAPVTMLVLCKREPEFGFGNYYHPILPEEE